MKILRHGMWQLTELNKVAGSGLEPIVAKSAHRLVSACYIHYLAREAAEKPAGIGSLRKACWMRKHNSLQEFVDGSLDPKGRGALSSSGSSKRVSQ